MEVMETIDLACDVYESGVDPNKSPIILLHGLFWNKYMMRDVAEPLCRVTKRKVFSLDLRCHDESLFCEKWNADIMAEDIKDFIKDRNLEKVVFVCHSFSCTLAYLVLLDEPDKVEKVVMIDHVDYSDYTDEFYQENVVPQFKSQNRFLQSLDPALSLAEAKKKILDISTASATEAQKLFLKKIAYELIKEGNRFKWKTDHKAIFDGYLKNCRPPARGRSDHEILVLRCKGSSRVSDKKFEKFLHYNPNSKLVTFEDSSHLLMFEKQEEFLDIVKTFLS